MFFNLSGEVIHYIDLTELVDMSLFIALDACFNVPIAVFQGGSYFGDNDVMF